MLPEIVEVAFKRNRKCYYFNPNELMHRTDVISKGKDGSFSIENLNLTIPNGKTMVVLGPTGCGKTTILRIIAGLEEPDSGEVKYDGVNILGTPPKDRRIGIVFQNYALYRDFFVDRLGLILLERKFII